MGSIRMNAAERKIALYAALQKHGSVEVQALTNKFNVSAMTIRRDLKNFEKQGLVTMSYGGAHLNQQVAVEPSFYIKSSQFVEQKQQIARAAADLICEGETIVLDCGTTTLQIVKYIQNKKLTIITNSWPVVNFLGKSTKIKIILAPGVYDDISAGTFGGATTQFLSSFHADRVFLGTHGVDTVRGATVPELQDAETKQALMRAGKKKYLLADSNKFGASFLVSHGLLQDFDAIFTDSNLSEEMGIELAGHGANIVIAK